jgi:hypothetical protein
VRNGTFVKKLTWLGLTLLVVVTCSALISPVGSRLTQAARAATSSFDPIYLPLVPNRPVDPCTVTSMQRLPYLGKGPDWSHTTGQVAVSYPDASQVWQVYLQDIQGTSPFCVTCNPPAKGPAPGNFKTMPNFGGIGASNGQWLVMQVEMNGHPPITDYVTREASVLNGTWADLYLVSTDGATWVNLTHYSNQPPVPPYSEPIGSLIPVFSADGTQLLWSALVREGDATHQVGYWHLQLASVTFTDGLPSLTNVRDPLATSTNPLARAIAQNASFLESGGFSPDGSSILFIADVGANLQPIGAPDFADGMDLWQMSLTTGQVTNLTNSPTQWDEHPKWSPHGNKVVWMSSYPYPTDVITSSLTTEFMLTNPGGGVVPQQLTHFNARGYPESQPVRAVAAGPAWSADGSQLLLAQLVDTNFPNDQDWLLTFAGPCG